jgi:tripartite-type tricarboxylate transporter receptor subunit TctC
LKATPPDIIALLNREITAAVQDPKLKARFADLGAASMPMPPSDFGKLLREDTDKWGEVVRTAKITPI